MPNDAEVEEVGEIPIREVSGLAVRTRGSRQVLAIGDRDFELAVGTLTAAGAVHSFDVVDLGEAMRKAGIARQETSQWEGIQSDSAGRVFVLEENPGHIFVFDETGKELAARIELTFHTSDTGLKEAWEANPNSRGEGLLLLEKGHLLVLKEKEPRRLIEFGPAGDAVVGLRPLRIGTAFSLPGHKHASMVPLETWKFSDESKLHFRDLSDLAVDEDGRLWVMSDEGRAIGQLTGDVVDGRLEIGSMTKLPAKQKFTKPEGLAFLSRTRALVACDSPERTTTLFSIELDRP